jgi:NAD(P)-dependent dehydrogenase (short-subunit alcohol dehydrogenase family)
MTSSYDFDPKATYVIAGGLGGLGRSIARWMASRKARNMILLSRTATLSIAAKTLLEELRAKGIKVVTPPCDISDRDSLALALTECSKTLPRIRGCVQSSLVIKV